MFVAEPSIMQDTYPRDGMIDSNPNNVVVASACSGPRFRRHLDFHMFLVACDTDVSEVRNEGH